MTPASKCPVCGKSAHAESIPFCSKRCKDVDLARWFRGDYAVPATESEELPDDEGEDDISLH